VRSKSSADFLGLKLHVLTKLLFFREADYARKLCESFQRIIEFVVFYIGTPIEQILYFCESLRYCFGGQYLSDVGLGGEYREKR
jgi:hypothetical protein